MKKLFILVTILLMTMTLVSCKNEESVTEETKEEIVVVEEEINNEIDYKYLTSEECAEVLGSIDDYYARLNQRSLDYLSQKKGTTVQEYKEYSMAQALEYNDEEKAYIDNVLADLENKMQKLGIVLPENRSVSFCLTTMNEALGAGGYTHQNFIFLAKDYLDKNIANGTDGFNIIELIVAHELFHCLTRNNPDFRKDMYSIIGFTVTDKDFDIPDDIYEQIIANPDVAHHDSYATFTINGEKRECYLVFLCESDFENPGDSFFDSMYTGVIDKQTGELYKAEDVSDFYDVVGNNTTYCEDPEECMADNFSFIMTYGRDGENGNGYKSPEIIEAIISHLQK